LKLGAAVIEKEIDMAIGPVRPSSPEASVYSDHSQEMEIVVHQDASLPKTTRRMYAGSEVVRSKNAASQARCRARKERRIKELEDALAAERSEKEALQARLSQNLQDGPLAMHIRRRKALEADIEERKKAFDADIEERKRALDDHSRKGEELEAEYRRSLGLCQREEAVKMREDEVSRTEKEVAALKSELHHQQAAVCQREEAVMAREAKLRQEEQVAERLNADSRKLHEDLGRYLFATGEDRGGRGGEDS